MFTLRLRLAVYAIALSGCGADVPSEESVRAAYVVLGDTLTGHLSATNQFKKLGNASVVAMFPDSSFCHTYFALADGTYCYRAHANEPFQARRLDAFAVPFGPAADSLLSRTLGDEYQRLRSMLFVQQYTVSPRVRCASFLVSQLLRTLDTATFVGMATAKAGKRASGIGCEVDGRRYAFVDSSTDISLLVPWDVIDTRSGPLLLFQRYGDENGQLELFEARDSALRKLFSIPLWSL